MTSKLTREELLNIIETDHVQCGEASALARMALAAMDSEPVGTLSVRAMSYSGKKFGTQFGFVHSDAAMKVPEGDYPLYRHAQPAPVVPDEMLCEFYEVANWPDLVRELVKHVEQLQDSAKRNVKPWEDTFPETLLPAYIERVKQADDACRAAMLQAGNSPVIPDGYVMVPKEPTKKMLIRAVATMSGCAPSLVDESDEELDDIREAYLDMLKVAPQLTIVANSDESQGVKDDVNKIINILKNGDWSDTHGYRGLKTEAGLALESEIEKIVALIEPSPTLAIDAIDAHLRKVLQETKGAQLLRKVVGHNWTPVSERMPEIAKNWLDVTVIIAVRGEKHGSEALYCSDGEFRWGRDESPIEDVTHWMPLPAAPQEVK